MRYHQAGERAPTLVRQQTVAETWERIKQYTTPASIGVHSYLDDGRPLHMANAGGFRSGSFKERGGLARMLELSDEGYTEAIACSTGNHASGSALGAFVARMSIHVFMPPGVPPVKKDRTLETGGGRASVHETKMNFDTTLQYARAYAEAHGLPFVEPFNHMTVALGQGTLALEMVQARPNLNHLLVPEGGAGLAGGCVKAIYEANKETIVYGVKLTEMQELCEGSNVARRGDVAQSIFEQHPELWGGTLYVTPAELGAMVALEDAVRAEHYEAMGDAAYVDYPEATSLLAAAAAHKYSSQLRGEVGIVMTGSNADQGKLGTLHDLYVAEKESSAQPGFHMASGYQLRRAA